MIRGTDHFGHQEAAGIVPGLFWARRDLHNEFVWTLRTGATELALSCTWAQFRAVGQALRETRPGSAPTRSHSQRHHRARASAGPGAGPP